MPSSDQKCIYQKCIYNILQLHSFILVLVVCITSNHNPVVQAQKLTLVQHTVDQIGELASKAN